MDYMKKLFVCVVIVLYTALAGFGQSSESKNNPPSAEIPTVTFCDLIKHTSDFKDKVVRVRVVHTVGFEWTAFKPIEKNCKESAWVELDKNYEQVPESKVTVKTDSKLPAGQTYSIKSVVGKIYKGGKFGHLGSYKYQFVLQRTEEVEIITSDKQLPPPKILILH